MDKKAVFAVFYDAVTNTVAATTRPEDTTVSVGLPGGKVDIGETNEEALIRECFEEGWNVSGSEIKFFHSQVVNDFEVFWYLIDRAEKLEIYKEQYRNIVPQMVDIELLCFDSTYGNDCLLKLKE